MSQSLSPALRRGSVVVRSVRPATLDSLSVPATRDGQPSFSAGAASASLTARGLRFQSESGRHGAMRDTADGPAGSAVGAGGPRDMPMVLVQYSVRLSDDEVGIRVGWAAELEALAEGAELQARWNSLFQRGLSGVREAQAAATAEPLDGLQHVSLLHSSVVEASADTVMHLQYEAQYQG